MKRLLFPVLLAAGFVFAQDNFAQMTDLLERGLYNSAALVAGPALVSAHPEDRRAHELHARALLLTGDVAAARQALDIMLELEPAGGPQGVNELHLAGLILAAEGDHAAAVELLAEAFSGSANYEHAMDWARVSWLASFTDQAMEAYRQAAATQRGEREPWPWLDLGRLQLFQGELDEAEASFERAISVYETFDTGISLPSPAYVEAFYRLGQLAELRFAEDGAASWLNEAEDNYRNALVGDPNYLPAQLALERLGSGAR